MSTVLDWCRRLCPACPTPHLHHHAAGRGRRSSGGGSRLGVLRLATRAIDRFAGRLEREGVLDEGAALRQAPDPVCSLDALVRGRCSSPASCMLRGIGLRGIPRVSTEDLVAWLIGPGVRLVVIATSAYLVTRCIHFLIDSLQIFLVSRDATQRTCSSARSAWTPSVSCSAWWRRCSWSASRL